MPAGEDGKREHRERGDAGDAGGESVQAIDKIDDIGKGDQVDDGNGISDPTEFNVGVACKGVDDLVNHQTSRNGNARGDDLACEFGLWGELDNIVCGTRCHHEQDGDRKQMIIDGEAGVRYQDRRPSEVRTAKDGNDHCDQEAKENGESTEARRRLRVDASFGWVVDGVETYGQALCCGCADKGHNERRGSHSDIWKESFHAKSNTPVW